MSQTTAPAPSQQPAPDQPTPDAPPSLLSRGVRALLTQRIVLLAALLVVVLVWMTALDLGGYLTGAYDADYLAGALVDAVPLCLLALGELVVIVSGRGGIDLSIGAMVSLTGMVFGFAYGRWGWSLLAAVVLAVVVGAAAGSGERVHGGLPALPGPHRHVGELLRVQVAGPGAHQLDTDLGPADRGPLLDHPTRRDPGGRPARCPTCRSGSSPSSSRRWSWCGSSSPAPPTAGGCSPSAPTTSPPSGPAWTCAAPGSRPTSSPGSSRASWRSTSARSSPRPDRTPGRPATAWRCRPSPSRCSAAWPSPVASGGWRAWCSRRCSSRGSTRGSCWPSPATTAPSSSCSPSAPCSSSRPCSTASTQRRYGGSR